MYWVIKNLDLRRKKIRKKAETTLGPKGIGRGKMKILWVCGKHSWEGEDERFQNY